MEFCVWAELAILAQAFQCCVRDVEPGLLHVFLKSAKLASASPLVTCTICKTHTQFHGLKRQPHDAYTELSATKGA